MRLLFSELRKACAARAVAVFFALLLAANFALTYISSRPMPVEAAAREVYYEYLRDPEAVISYMEQLEADFFDHRRDEEFEPPRTYTDGADDISVLNRVLSRAEYISSYRSETEKIVSAAERRARELGYLGYSAESFRVIEQVRLAEAYSSVAGALDGYNSYAYGYESVLCDARVCIFIALYVIFAVSYVFRNDRVCGFMSVMRASKKGRLPSLTAKLGAALLITVGATVAFTLTSFAAARIANGGFSSAFDPVQLIPAFAKIPFEVSILGFALLLTALRALAACILALLCALIASAGLNYFLCFSISALFCAANYLAFSYDYVGTAPALKYLNLASAADGTALLSFHRDIWVFGRPITYPLLLAVICIAAAVVLAVLCAVVYCNSLAVGAKRVKIAIGRKKETKKCGTRLQFCMPLWVWELRKSRALPTLLLACLLIAAQGAYISAAIGDGMSFGEAVYYTYIEKISTLSEDERAEYIAFERAELEATVASYAEICEKLEANVIGYDEYSAFLPEYYDANSKLRVLSRVEEYLKYISAQSKKIGKEITPAYTTGYEKFFAEGESFLVFAAILAISVSSFCVEYRSGNCAAVIKTAKRGRRETFFAKILPRAAVSALLSASARGIGLAVTASRYRLPDPKTPICAVREFSSLLTDVSVAEYIAFDLICSAAAGALTATAVCALSRLCKKALPTIGASAAILALPSILFDSPLILFDITAPKELFCLGTPAIVIILSFHAVTCMGLIAIKNFRRRCLIDFFQMKNVQ